MNRAILAELTMAVWEQLQAEAGGTNSGTRTEAERGRKRPETATIPRGGSVISEGAYGTHNAGVAGSSPAPATTYDSSVPTAVPVAVEAAPTASHAPRPGWFAWCAWKVGPDGRPIVLATCYASDLSSAKAHFGNRGPSVAVSSRLALQEMGRLPVPEQPDRYGRPVRPRGGVGPRKAGCEAERVDFRQRRFA